MKAFVGYSFLLLFVMYNGNCLKFDKYEKAPECEEHGVYTANPDNCAGFFMCFRGRLLSFRCHWGLHWNATHKYCDLPADVDCNGIPADTNTTLTPLEPVQPDVTEKPPPPTSRFTECSQHGAYSADPDNCLNYFMCFQGRLKKYRCHWNLHWNAKEKRCQSPEDAKCAEEFREKPTEPTATDSTATESTVTESIATNPTATDPTSTDPTPPSETTKEPVVEKEKLKVLCYCK